MGLGVDDDVIVDDGDGESCGGGGGSNISGSILCSICLEEVTDLGDQSWAKLQCGHEFHLDCIGSAFNVKGAMQCPNCREIGKGQWLYANGSPTVPEFSMDYLTPDEDLYDHDYFVMQRVLEMRQQIQDEIRQELLEEMRQQVRQETEEMRRQIQEMRQQMQDEIQQELLEEMRQQVRHEMEEMQRQMPEQIQEQMRTFFQTSHHPSPPPPSTDAESPTGGS